jgi:uncharacterized membrane protein YfcA
MDDTVLGIFLLATFVGGVVAGIAGFAMSLVVSGVWLHILTPIQTVTLIVGYGILVQGYGIWTLRRALSWRRVAPFIISSTAAVPIGVALLTRIDPAQIRAGVGILLLAYAIYGLAQPAIKPVPPNRCADIGVGFVNGLLGGLTGLAGIVLVVWCQLRGWPKDVQRTTAQPVVFAAFVMSAISLTVTGEVATETVKLYLLGLPLALGGTWMGLNLYGRFGETGFRRIVLLLLLASGISLIISVSQGI